ncbi:DNA adenine methylase [Burkholderia gladioli]|uniref:DNA adenine methylase n=1 Tax=Burkholderia gladioli TaxID=28095 RepID=UPI001FC834A2|nr:DNA adenine methylase [Burkholderia gladioli]
MEELKEWIEPVTPSPGARKEANLPRKLPRAYPQVIKYMGSKATLLSFIGESLGKVHSTDRPLVDLFAGACAISGGFGHATKIIANDIQEYSATIGNAYLRMAPNAARHDVITLASKYAREKLDQLPRDLVHAEDCSLEEFNAVEERNRALLNTDFSIPYHLFTRTYSGTWWSAEQCVWIDSIRQALDSLLEAGLFTEPDYRLGLTCLMHAMAYTSQGTGHYAQYRDAKTDASMKDIHKYRRQSVSDLFDRKFASLIKWNNANAIDLGHELMSLDYIDCLEKIPASIVYADPPYAFVHYSRFYHAIETVTKYDYPELQIKSGKMVKGRYRVDRHQSPFCISSSVQSAFVNLFDGVKDSKSDLILSYSNTGMLEIDDLIELANQKLGSRYNVWVENLNHNHMTMGRREDRTRQVEESLIIAKRT